jgi:DNA polymerase-3 subunit delta'
MATTSGAAGTAGTAERTDHPMGVLGPPDAQGRPGGLLPWLGEPLRALLDDRRHAQALLLLGAPGVGQFELAVAAAQSWLCEAAEHERPGGGAACGACAACRLVQAQTHPDLRIVLPEALREPLRWAPAGPGDDAAAADAGASRRKPSRELRVDDVRQAIAFAQTTSSRGGAKVIVLHPAERLNAIAANALLKTLEEPPEAVRFVIVTGDAARLLPTLRSRCRPLPVGLPSPELAERWLADQGVRDADVLLAATGGQPLDALALRAEGVDAAAWSALPAVVAAGDSAPLQAWPLPRLVDALLRLCGDLQRLGCGAAPRHFPAAALPRTAPPLAALNGWGRRLLAEARHAEHPYHVALAVDALVADAHAVLTGR